MQWNLCGAWSLSSARRLRRFLAMSSIIIGYSRSLPAVTSSISTTARFTRGSMLWISALTKSENGSPSNIDRVSETLHRAARISCRELPFTQERPQGFTSVAVVALLANILDCVVRFCTERNNRACGQLLPRLIMARADTELNRIVEGISLIVCAARHSQISDAKWIDR